MPPIETINMRNLYFISSVIQLFLFGYILTSFVKLESAANSNCPKNDWRRIYIMAFSAVAVLMALVELGNFSGLWRLNTYWFYPTYFIAMILFTYCAITYAYALKCGAPLTKDILYLVGIINVAVLSVSAVIILLVVLANTRK